MVIPSARSDKVLKNEVHMIT